MIDEKQILGNWESLIKIIENSFTGERRENLLNLYNALEDRMSIAPASGIVHYHNCFAGGYVDHVLRVIECAQKVADTWVSLGVMKNWADEELIQHGQILQGLSDQGLLRLQELYPEGILDKPQIKLTRKTPKGKAKYQNIQKEYTREIKKHVRNLEQVVRFQNLLIDAKMQIVKKLNSVRQLTNTFIRTNNGYKVVNPEGYVAIDRVSGNAVKLVDRMEFSFNNFTAIKTWDK